MGVRRLRPNIVLCLLLVGLYAANLGWSRRLTALGSVRNYTNATPRGQACIPKKLVSNVLATRIMYAYKVRQNKGIVRRTFMSKGRHYWVCPAQREDANALPVHIYGEPIATRDVSGTSGMCGLRQLTWPRTLTRATLTTANPAPTVRSQPQSIGPFLGAEPKLFAPANETVDDVNAGGQLERRAGAERRQRHIETEGRDIRHVLDGVARPADFAKRISVFFHLRPA